MKSIVRFILSVSCVALLIHGCDKQANESSSPVLRLKADEEITVPAEGGNFSIGYTVENPVAEGRVEAAADSSDWVGGFDCSSEGTVSFHVSENAGDESRVAVVSLTYVYPEGESLPVTVEVMQEGTAENVPDDKDIFGIDVSDVTVSSVSIHAVCNEPGLAWTTQVISKNEFESQIGSMDNMEEYFMQMLEATALHYGYEDMTDFLEELLITEDSYDYVNSSLIPSTEYMTYAVGMDYGMNLTTDFFWGPEFVTSDVQLGGLEFDVNVTPKVSSAILEIHPSDAEAVYVATVIDAGFYSGYTDEEIMGQLSEFLYPRYSFSGDETLEVSDLKPGTRYIAVVFGIDPSTGLYNSALSKTEFSTEENTESDAFVEGSVTKYWSVYDLIDYNPEYQNLLRDTSKTGIAAVELEYNESAVSCCFPLWSTDYSYMDYETMYAYTAEYGQIVDKGDPATLIYVSFGATNTLCSIGIDADGNYGEMHTYYVTYTEDGRCMDFGLYDEYYAAALAGQTAVRMPFIMPETVSSTLLSVPAVHGPVTSGTGQPIGD